MPRFAANLSMLYAELPFLDRFEAAAGDGFEAVEFFFPYDHAPRELAARLRDHGLRLVFFNATPRRDPAERGIACLPGRGGEFRDGFLRALDYALALDCPNLHVMPGIAPADVPRPRLEALYLDNLVWACERARAVGRTVLIEPINRRDVPGFLLTRQAQAHALIDAAGQDNLKVQMDFYHCQVEEGDALALARRYLPTGRVGHLQLAGAPERREPDRGEIDLDRLFALVDASGYDGWVGAEYHPAAGAVPGATSAGLGWLRAWGGPRPRARAAADAGPVRAADRRPRAA